MPMDLLGDRLVDERAEWRVIGRPYTTTGGKMAHVRVESVKQPGSTDIRTWGAHRARRDQAGMKRCVSSGNCSRLTRCPGWWSIPPPPDTLKGALVELAGSVRSRGAGGACGLSGTATKPLRT